MNHNLTSYNIHSVDFFSSTKFKIFVILGTTLNPGESFLILMKKRKRKERSNNVYELQVTRNRGIESKTLKG